MAPAGCRQLQPCNTSPAPSAEYPCHLRSPSRPERAGDDTRSRLPTGLRHKERGRPNGKGREKKLRLATWYLLWGPEGPRQSRINRQAGAAIRYFTIATAGWLPARIQRQSRRRDLPPGYLPGPEGWAGGGWTGAAGGSTPAARRTRSITIHTCAWGRAPSMRSPSTNTAGVPSTPSASAALAEARTWVSSWLARHASSLAASSLATVACWRAMRSSAPKLLAESRFSPLTSWPWECR